MEKVRILSLIGGISSRSINQNLYEAFKHLAPTEVELQYFPIDEIPFFSQDLENDVPAIVRDLRSQIRNADAILIITPEYNRSFPGVLKNAIDWASRPYGQSSWDNKIGAIVGASIGNIGTFGAQHHLRQVLAYLNVRTMGQPEFYLNAAESFDENGNLIKENQRKFIQNYWTSFLSWINSNRSIDRGLNNFRSTLILQP